jgi:acetolactate synthase I/II/III large subunit
VKTSQQVAKLLRLYDVTHFFFVPVILPETLKRMPELGITPVMTHGETAAAYMADGYARISGKVGVCGAQAIGSTNLAAGLRDAYMARVPIVAMSGAPSISDRHRNLYQDVDDRAAYDALTKWHADVPDESRFPDLLRQAFRCATSGVSRPVHLALSSRTGNPGDTDAVGDGRAEPQYSRAPSARPCAAADEVRRALTILANARRPVILAGNGVARSRAEPELLALAKAGHIPVVTSLNGISTIMSDDPLFGGVVGEYGADWSNRILLESDVVVVAGSALGSMTTRRWSLFSQGTKIIQIDIDGSEIGRNFEVEVALVGDAGAVLTQLSAGVSFKSASAWLSRVQELRGDWLSEVAGAEYSAELPMRPERLVTLAFENAADDAVFVADTGHIAAWTARHGKLRSQQRLIRSAGSLGWALPAAVGAKCAEPGREVICLTGDGGAYWHIAELETMRRYDLPLVVVINNNSSMNQEASFWEHGDPAQSKNWMFRDTDFAAIARGFGCHGVRVDSPEEFAKAFTEIRASGLPAVIDARTDTDVVAPVSFGPPMK